MTHCETILSSLQSSLFWSKWRLIGRTTHCIKVLAVSAVILFAEYSFAADNTSSEDNAPINFWFQSSYSGGVMLNKIRPLLSDLDDSFNQRFVYQATLQVEYLLSQIEKSGINIILWGHDPFLASELDALGYEMVLSTPVEVSLYQLAIKPEDEDAHLSRTETFTIGTLINSTALNTVKKYYVETPQHMVSMKEYESYIDLMQALANAEVDYIAATLNFTRPMIDSMKKRYRKVLQYPQAGSVSMHSNMRDKGQIKLLQDYFIENSPTFNRVFGSGVFTVPDARQSDAVGTTVE